MTLKQLKHNTKIEGGFLGLLTGLAARALLMIVRTVLPALAVGDLSGLASLGVQKTMGSVSISREEDAFPKWKWTVMDYT